VAEKVGKSLGFLSTRSDELNALFRQLLPPDWSFVSSDGNADMPIFADNLPKLDYIVASATPLRKMHIARAINLKFVQKVGVGYDDIDVEALQQRGIPLAVCPIGTSDAVAEHALALTLAAMKALIQLDRDVKSHLWPRWEARKSLRLLTGRAVGIVGFGRAGKRVAELFLAFGCRVLAYVRNPPSLSATLEVALKDGRLSFVKDLDSLFRLSDIISLHVPLTTETNKLVNAQRLSLLGPDGLLVNVSRGEVVDEAALLAALRNGELGFAAVDVLCHEPPAADDPLLTCPHIIITPHLGGGGLDVLNKKIELIVGNCMAHAATGAAEYVVDFT
jgi:D-3-phosphoglycerate dehydrogenase